MVDSSGGCVEGGLLIVSIAQWDFVLLLFLLLLLLPYWYLLTANSAQIGGYVIEGTLDASDMGETRCQ